MNYSPKTHKRNWLKADVNRSYRLTRKNMQKAMDEYSNICTQKDLKTYRKYSGIRPLDIALAFIAAFGIGLYNGSWAMGFWTFIFMMAIFIIAFEEKDKFD